MYKTLADMACERITTGITQAFEGQKPIKAVLDPYNPIGSTAHVNFNTSKTHRWETDARRCHVNWVILDSDWEASSVALPSRIHGSGLMSKTITLGLRSPIVTAQRLARTCLTSYCWWIDGRGEKDLLHLISKSKVIDARTPR
jgi:type III restriction enzyme